MHTYKQSKKPIVFEKVKKYSNISIPRATFLRLTRIVGHQGFRSTAEVVMHCIRKCDHQINGWLDEIEKNLKEKGREFV